MVGLYLAASLPLLLSAEYPAYTYPQPPANWDDFVVLDPTAYPQKGGFVPEKKLRLVLNHVYPSRFPNEPQWTGFEMDYDITGRLEFSTKWLDIADPKWTPQNLTPEMEDAMFRRGSLWDFSGLRFITKNDVLAWIAALHKFDAWSNIAAAKGVDNAVKEITRSRWYIYTFVVTNRQLWLRVTKNPPLEALGTKEPLLFGNGAQSHDFSPNEVRIFEFLMSKIKDLQQKLAAAQKADPFK